MQGKVSQAGWIGGKVAGGSKEKKEREEETKKERRADGGPDLFVSPNENKAC